MARRYTTIPGLGRCTIVLEGLDADRRKRARLAFHIDTGRVYLVGSSGLDRTPTSVTACSTYELLDRLNAFEWWLPLGPIEDDGDDG